MGERNLNKMNFLKTAYNNCDLSLNLELFSVNFFIKNGG